MKVSVREARFSSAFWSTDCAENLIKPSENEGCGARSANSFTILEPGLCRKPYKNLRKMKVSAKAKAKAGPSLILGPDLAGPAWPGRSGGIGRCRFGWGGVGLGWISRPGGRKWDLDGFSGTTPPTGHRPRDYLQSWPAEEVEKRFQSCRPAERG